LTGAVAAPNVIAVTLQTIVVMVAAVLVPRAAAWLGASVAARFRRA
jgi:hypothetical protein